MKPNNEIIVDTTSTFRASMMQNLTVNYVNVNELIQSSTCVLEELPVCKSEQPNTSYGYDTKADLLLEPEPNSKMETKDEDGFYEAYVGVKRQKYPVGKGRRVEITGYGVWFAHGSKGNLGGAVDEEDRPQFTVQYTKAAMILGSALAIDCLKEKGYTKIRINTASDYLLEHVVGWISKYMHEESAPPSNWDELKYRPEIIQLCRSAFGMIIKWSHCRDPLKRVGILNAELLAEKATQRRFNEFFGNNAT